MRGDRGARHRRRSGRGRSLPLSWNPNKAPRRSPRCSRAAHSRDLPFDARGRRPRSSSELPGHAAEDHVGGSARRARGRARSARSPPRAARGQPDVRDHGRDAADDLRRGRPGRTSRPHPRRTGALRGRALRHVRLHGVARDRARVPAHGAPRLRLRPPRHAGFARRDGRRAVGRLHERPARRRPGRRPRGVAPSLRGRPTVARKRLLSGLGPSPRPAAHAVCGEFRILLRK